MSIYKELKYDFDPFAVCEAQIKGKWYRVTARTFRSFDGPRRVSHPNRQPGHGEMDADIHLITENYTGPVYAYMSNVEVSYKGTERIINHPDGEYQKGVTEVRGKKKGKVVLK